MSCPDRLYKYQALTAYTLGSVLNESIWLAKPSSFNDPIDCAITLDSSRTDDSIRHAIEIARSRTEDAVSGDIRPEDREAYQRFREQMLSLLQNMGVCSFSAVGDHLLMWSHYANHHHGFCVEYDASEGTMLRKLAHQVLYSDTVPSMGAADFAPGRSLASFDRLWLTKASCWSYEQEWRILMQEGNKPFQAPSRVISLTFGARMPESERTMVKCALRNQPEIRFKEARLVEGKFLLEIAAL